MKKLTSWILSDVALRTTQELEVQRENARAAHVAATEAVDAARVAFDADPGKETALLKAEEEARRAEAHVGRAERLLEARRVEEVAQEAEKLAQLRDQTDEEYKILVNELRSDDATDVTAALMACARAQALREMKIQRLSEWAQKLASLEEKVHGIPYLETRQALQHNESMGTLAYAARLFFDEVSKFRQSDPVLYRIGHDLHTRLTSR